MRRTFFQKCLRYLIPPRCGGCGVLLDPSDPGDLCGTCQAKWDQLLAEPCPRCRKPAAACTCQASELATLSDVTHLSLLFYKHYDKERLSDQMLYQAKRKENANSRYVFAACLSENLLAYAEEHNISLSNYVILYPPRSEENLRKYGFDHAALLSRDIARLCGMQHRSLFRRKGGEEQKLFDATARRENAESTIFLKNPPSKAATGFVLFDDVVTTGATVARCIRLLREETECPVIVLSVAKTMPKVKESIPPSRLMPKDEPLWFE